MIWNILKFLGLLIGMLLIGVYIPFGMYVNTGIISVALWNLIADN